MIKVNLELKYLKKHIKCIKILVTHMFQVLITPACSTDIMLSNFKLILCCNMWIAVHSIYRLVYSFKKKLTTVTNTWGLKCITPLKKKEKKKEQNQISLHVGSNPPHSNTTFDSLPTPIPLRRFFVFCFVLFFFYR